MALSKEEISIRLGIDAKSVKAGLDSATGYISKWRKRQSAEEREYTSFWKSELDKRDKLEIESAARRNRARALLREREEKRNAASASGIGGQDTVSRSVELANKEGKGVFAKASKQLGSYAGNVISGAVMGVVGMMTSMVTDLITRAVDKASDYMSKTLYDTLEGINDRMVANVYKQHDRKIAAKESSKEVAAENERMDKEEARAAFEKKSAEDRASISKDIVEATNKEMDAAKASFEQAKRQQKELIALNKGSIEATAEGFELVAAAERRILEARKANKSAMEDYGKALQDIKIADASTDGPVAGAFSFAQPRHEILTPLQKVDDYMSKIRGGQDAYKAKTDYSGWGKAMKDAQKQAAAEVVQKVAIVEIKE